MAVTRGLQGLLACDLDGTLVASDGSIFDGATNLLGLRHRSFTVGIASARPMRAIHPIVDLIGPVSFISALQGAQVWSAIADEEELYEARLPGELVRRLRQHASEGAEVWSYTSSGWFVSQESATVREECRLVGFEPSGSLKDAEDEHVLKCVVVGEQELPAELAAELGALGAIYGRSSAPYVEVVAASTPSAKGISLVKEVWERHKSGRTRLSCAVGDSKNDLDMLRLVDLGFTFENAVIAKAPGVVTVPAPRNGGLLVVAEMLERLSRADPELITSEQGRRGVITPLLGLSKPAAATSQVRRRAAVPGCRRPERAPVRDAGRPM